MYTPYLIATIYQEQNYYGSDSNDECKQNSIHLLLALKPHVNISKKALETHKPIFQLLCMVSNKSL